MAPHRGAERQDRMTIGEANKGLTWAQEEALVNKAVADHKARWGAVFGLRAFPGEVFEVNRAASYFSSSYGVFLYTSRLTEGGWADFAKGTPAELDRETIGFDRNPDGTFGGWVLEKLEREEARKSGKQCRNCHRAAKVGVFCCQCMKRFREDKKRDKAQKAYWMAVEAGAGDLWREGY